MPRSSHRRIAAAALCVLLTAATPALAAGGRAIPAGAPVQAWEELLQTVRGLWEGLGSLWSAVEEEGDAGARIDGNGSRDQVGVRTDGNGATEESAAQLEGEAGARIDGNGNS